MSIVRFVLSGDSSSLKTAAKEGEKSLADLRKEFSAGIATAAKWTAGATLAGAAIVTALVNNARQAIDQQAKLAQQLNTTSESMAVLTRAGDLSGVGMEKIASGARALTVRLSQAAAGAGPAAEALKQMGMTANELAAMPLDQRIEAINQKIRETYPAAQQAAIAAQFFGEEAGTAFANLSSDSLAQARKEAELFGLALSDVDAAKVEMANDSFSTISQAFKGIVQQLTVELAPILKAIGDQFMSAAEDAGGMGNIVSDAFAMIIDGTGFVIDAIDGIKRTFTLVADGIIAAAGTIVSGILSYFQFLLEQMDKVPGIDLSETIASIEGFKETASGVASEAMDNISETLNRPMPSEAFKQFVADAQAAGQAAAEATVAAREAMDTTITDMNSARSEQEIAEIEKRLEAIRMSNMTELELLNEKYALEVEAMKIGLEEKLITEQEAQAMSLDAAQRFSDAKLAIEQKRAEEEKRIEAEKEAAKKAILSQAFGGLTSLMNSNSRKMFEVGKAAAIGQAIISTYTGMNKALELGWPLGPIAAAAIGVQGFARVQSIRSQSFGGGKAGAGGAGGSVTQNVNAQNEPVQPQRTANVSIAVDGSPLLRDLARSLVRPLNELQQEGYTLGAVNVA